MLALRYTSLCLVALLQYNGSTERQIWTNNVTVNWLPKNLWLEIVEDNGIKTVVKGRKGAKKSDKLSQESEKDYETSIKSENRTMDLFGQYHIIQNGLIKPTMVDYFIGKLTTRPYRGKFISDQEILLLENSEYYIHNLDKRYVVVIMGREVYNKLEPKDILFSADRQYMMAKTSSEKIWRHSTKAHYKLIKMVGNRWDYPDSKWFPNNKNKQKLRFFSWSPIGHSLIYVDMDNNLHYQVSPEEKIYKLTYDGDYDSIYNGVPDWVYEEEILAAGSSVWWAPDGEALVYASFNDKHVEEIQLPNYGTWHRKEGKQYPLLESIRYPKVGTRNPEVKVWFVQLRSKKGKVRLMFRRIFPPKVLTKNGRKAILTMVSWVNNKTVAVNWMNRIQTLSFMMYCHTGQKVKCNQMYAERESDGWVTHNKAIKFNKHKELSSFLAIYPEKVGLRLRKLFLFENNDLRRLTERDAEVTEILEWTPSDTVYYIATGEGQPGERYLYRLNLRNCSMNGCNEICLSCENDIKLLKHRGPCLYAHASISPEGSFVILECKGPSLPYSIIVNTKSGAVDILAGHMIKEKGIRTMQIPRSEYLQIPLKDSPVKAQVEILWPPEVDNAGPDEKFPMLVYVYGGPSSQQVAKTWGKPKDINPYLAASKGVVVITIDARGTGFSGETHRHETYRRFGTIEVYDVISVTKKLQKKFPFLDTSRTGIWGWSYGGFLSLSILASSPVFKCGISVAPVTRWDLYDTIYTERYMSSLFINSDGYNASSPLWKVEGLRDKEFLLVHGTHDDNVHLQNSIFLMEALEESNILFQEKIYVDLDHSIANYRQHLYHTIANFFMTGCFRNGYKHKHEDKAPVLVAG